MKQLILILLALALLGCTSPVNDYSSTNKYNRAAYDVCATIYCDIRAWEHFDVCGNEVMDAMGKQVRIEWLAVDGRRMVLPHSRCVYVFDKEVEE